MRAVIQRVLSAEVKVDGNVTGSIDHGLLVLLGIEENDQQNDCDWLASKVAKMRIFPDEEGKMNQCVMDKDGGILVVSQFTLFASTKKGNRPSFLRSAEPDRALKMYGHFANKLEEITGKRIPTGIFGADMKVSLVNDGPVTIIIDSQDRV